MAARALTLVLCSLQLSKSHFHIAKRTRTGLRPEHGSCSTGEATAALQAQAVPKHVLTCPRAQPPACGDREGSTNLEKSFARWEHVKASRDMLLTWIFLISDRKTWVSVTSVLALLLVISAVGNAGLFLKARSERHRESGRYLYQPLREMNGEASHPSTSAACEPEDPQDQSQALLQSPG